MDDVLRFVPPVLATRERTQGGVSVHRTTRAAYGAHEFRLCQSRHLIALHLSPAPIRSADRLGDRRLPQRARLVTDRINIVPAGVDWTSSVAPQARSEYLAVFVPDALFDAIDGGDAIRRSLVPALDLDWPRARAILRAVADDLDRPLYGALFVDGAVRQLLAEVGRAGSGNTAGAPASARALSPHQRRRLEALVDARMDRGLSVADLAAALALDPSTLHRAVRQTYGTSPYRWVTGLRIARARRLLADGDLPLAEVGARCGFDDQAHFTTAFRNAVGMPPGRYRRSVR